MHLHKRPCAPQAKELTKRMDNLEMLNRELLASCRRLEGLDDLQVRRGCAAVPLPLERDIMRLGACATSTRVQMLLFGSVSTDQA